MMERNRSLVPILVSGLVGLMLGLFIGWWVWPVEWTEPPAAVGRPAPAVPAAAPATGQIREEAAADTSFQDWLNQALLYLAAVLLLGGAVAIGYQFLRQAEQGGLSRRSAGSNNARQAAVRQARRPRPVFVSGKRTGSGAPGLDWLRRSRPSHDEAVVDEPVFPGQSGPLLNAGEGSRLPRPAELESLPGGGAGDESGQLTAGEEAAPLSAPLSAPRPPARTERGNSPAPFSAEERDQKGSAPTGVAGVPQPLHDRPPLPDETQETEVAQAFEAASGPQQAEAATAEDWFSAQQEGESNQDEAPQDRLAPAQEDPSSTSVSTGAERNDGGRPRLGGVLATFEANYAFGIQSYDESFTITAPDGELLGACGMGMNESLDRAAAETEQVRLLEIWLYDRSAVRSISRLLVSPGFDATLLDDRSEVDGADRSPPLELAPGLACGLTSRNIQLDCRVKNVSYLEDGESPRPLRSVSASLVVRGPA